jgi:WD40 repeat protein
MAKVWDLTRHPEHDAIGQTPLETEALVFRPDGRQLITASRGGRVQTWDAVAGLLVRERQLPMANQLVVPGAVAAFDPDGRRLAGLAAENPRIVRVWDVDSEAEPVPLRGHANAPIALRFSGDGRYLATAARNIATPSSHEVKVWRPTDGLVISEWTGAGKVWALDFSPDGRLLALTAIGRPVTVVDWRARQTVLEFASDGSATGVAFSPDGKQLASAERGAGVVRVWNVTGERARAEKQPLHTLRATDQEPYRLAYSPDGRRLAAVSRDAVKVWDAESGHPVITLRGAPRRHWDPAFNPQVAFSARRLAATNWDRSISVWDAEDLTPARVRDLRRAADERAASWHLDEAEACLARKDASGAAFHARYLRDSVVPPPLSSRRDDLLLAVGR